MRFAGALLLTLPLLGAALRRTQRLRRRERTLAAFCDFFRRLGALGAWQRLELPALLARVGAQAPDFRFPFSVLEAFDAEGDLPAAWAQAADSACALLRAEEKSALLAFSAVFESAAPAVFAERCRLAAEQFDAFAGRAREERARRARLTLSFGALGAALLVILLV